jgi:hypothetical protein
MIEMEFLLRRNALVEQEKRRKLEGEKMGKGDEQ